MNSRALFAAHSSLRGFAYLFALGAIASLAILALVTPPNASADLNHEFYDWCMNDVNAGINYCCAYAGGVVRDGQCVA